MARESKQPLLEDSMLVAVVKSKSVKGQRSTAARGSKGGSAKVKGSTQGKSRPRKRTKVADSPNLLLTRVTFAVPQLLWRRSTSARVWVTV